MAFLTKEQKDALGPFLHIGIFLIAVSFGMAVNTLALEGREPAAAGLWSSNRGTIIWIHNVAACGAVSHLCFRVRNRECPQPVKTPR